MRSILFKIPIMGGRFLRWWGRGGKDAVSAPSGTIDEWIKAYDYGARVIRERSGDKMYDHRVRCFDVPAEGSFGNGVYAWREVLLDGMWVRGLFKTTGSKDTGQAFAAIGPNGELQIGTMRHEVGGHHHLVQNNGDWSHNPLYDGLFQGWANARRVTGREVSVMKVIDGVQYHFDVVQGEPEVVFK